MTNKTAQLNRILFGVLLFIAAALMLLFMAVGCTRSEEANAGDAPSAGVMLDLNLRVGGDLPASRALSEADEQTVDLDNLRVLVFDEDEDLLRYVAPYVIRSQSRITLMLRTSHGEERYRVMVLVNAGDNLSLDDLKAAVGIRTYEEIAEIFSFDVTGKWASDGSRTIPLWGELGPLVIAAGMNIPTLPLLRSVARIDVGVDVKSDGSPNVPTTVTNFRMNTLRLFGSKTRGWTIPKRGFVTDPGTVSAEATQPSLYREVASNGIRPDGTYDATGNVGGLDYSPATEGARSVVREIYLAESEAYPADSVCLVVGGRYNPDPVANPSWTGLNTSYYRIDLLRPVTGELAPVLRNHRYLLNIVQATGPGAPTVEEALKSVSVNIKTDITVWKELSVTDTDEAVSLRIRLGGAKFATAAAGLSYCGDHASFRQSAHAAYLYPDWDDRIAAKGYDQERLVWNIAVAAYKEADGSFDELLTLDRFDAANNDLYVRIPRASYTRRLVVLANYPMGTSTAFAATLRGTTLATLGTKLSQTCTAFDSQLRWNYLPYSGVSVALAPGQIVEGSTGIGIQLQAAAARLDIGINYTDYVGYNGAGQTTGTYPFYLRSVRLAAWQNRFALLPALPDATALNGFADGTLATPSPSGTFNTQTAVAQMLRYDMSYPADADPMPQHVLLRTIYLAETAAGTTNTLIVGGGPSATSATNDTYYKVELPGPLLRSHRYVLNLSHITGAGAVTPEAALAATPAAVTATVLTWDNEPVDLPNVGQYTLSVKNLNTNQVVHTCKIGDVIAVTTTYPVWQLYNAAGALLESGVKGTNTLQKLTAAGSYTIRAGSLKWLLSVMN